MCVSYADIDQNHHGGIYQATNWVYEGKTCVNKKTAFIINGKKIHKRSVAAKGIKNTLSEVRKHLDPNAKEFLSKGKHKYLYPLCEEIKHDIMKIDKPYPKPMRG